MIDLLPEPHALTSGICGFSPDPEEYSRLAPSAQTRGLHGFVCTLICGSSCPSFAPFFSPSTGLVILPHRLDFFGIEVTGVHQQPIADRGGLVFGD